MDRSSKKHHKVKSVGIALKRVRENRVALRGRPKRLALTSNGVATVDWWVLYSQLPRHFTFLNEEGTLKIKVLVESFRFFLPVGSGYRQHYILVH